MRFRLMLIAAALALVAGCEREVERGAPASAGASAPPAQPQVNTPSTPANLGAPTSEAEKRESTSPVQGQVDPKASGQKEDFKRQSDAPKSGG